MDKDIGSEAEWIRMDRAKQSPAGRSARLSFVWVSAFLKNTIIYYSYRSLINVHLQYIIGTISFEKPALVY